MRKFFNMMLVLALAVTLVACGGGGSESSGELTGTYSVNITGDDWGCGVDKAIITLSEPLDAVTPESFKVTETKQVTDFTAEDFPVNETTVDRQITDAYLCDETGAKVDGASQYVALEMYISPNDGSPFLYDMNAGSNVWSDPYYLTITMADGAELTTNETPVTSLTIETAYTSRTTNADNFEKQTGTYEGVEYNYATYAPEEKSDKLFVWLHGGGEGGVATLGDATNVEVTLLANKVTALTGEDFQSTLGGCHILVPQCPTLWMDCGEGQEIAGRHSMYVDSLVALIDDYAAKNEITKIVIGGCSNGGYMTMNLAMDYGDKYQAYVPICEGMADKNISDEDIQALKDLPLYFVYSKDDTTLDPTIYENPTIERLRNAGATNLHVSTTEHVTDTSGRFTNEDGTPYTYAGHWSWIYFDNDETKCEDCSKSAFDWIAETIQ